MVSLLFVQQRCLDPDTFFLSVSFLGRMNDLVEGHTPFTRGGGDQRVGRFGGNFKALLNGGVGQAPLISSKSGLHALKKLATMGDKPA